MIPNPYNGRFIVFEGIDGCGKTEQLRRAAEWLRKKPATPRHRYVVETTKEPGKDRFWGAKIYKDLANSDGLHVMHPFGFQAWYACDSREHMRKIVIPCLEVGTVVLSDRFRHSMVFGIPPPLDDRGARKDALNKLMQLNQAILGEHFIWPDAAFVFDVSVETAISRLKRKFQEAGRGDFDGHEKADILERVRANYLLFAERYPNCHVIDAEGTPEKIFEKVKTIIKPVVAIIDSLF